MTETPKPRGPYFLPGERERERQDEMRGRQHKLDERRDRARRRGPPQAVRAYQGFDYLGRAYDDINRTGAWIVRFPPTGIGGS